MRHRLQSQAPGARASGSPGHLSSAQGASRSSSVGRRLSDVATTAEPSIVESALGSACGGCAGGADEPGDMPDLRSISRAWRRRRLGQRRQPSGRRSILGLSRCPNQFTLGPRPRPASGSHRSDQLDPITVQDIRGARGDPSVFVTGHGVVTAV